VHLLIIASTEENLKNIVGLSRASLNNVHDVTLFFNEKSVLLLTKPSLLDGINVTKLVCRTSFNELRLNLDDIIEGVKMSSLSELVELIEKSDKIVFAG